MNLHHCFHSNVFNRTEIEIRKSHLFQKQTLPCNNPPSAPWLCASASLYRTVFIQKELSCTTMPLISLFCFVFYFFCHLSERERERREYRSQDNSIMQWCRQGIHNTISLSTVHCFWGLFLIILTYTFIRAVQKPQTAHQRWSFSSIFPRWGINCKKGKRIHSSPQGILQIYWQQEDGWAVLSFILLSVTQQWWPFMCVVFHPLFSASHPRPAVSHHNNWSACFSQSHPITGKERDAWRALEAKMSFCSQGKGRDMPSSAFWSYKEIFIWAEQGPLDETCKGTVGQCRPRKLDTWAEHIWWNLGIKNGYWKETNKKQI